MSIFRKIIDDMKRLEAKYELEERLDNIKKDHKDEVEIYDDRNEDKLTCYVLSTYKGSGASDDPSEVEIAAVGENEDGVAVLLSSTEEARAEQEYFEAMKSRSEPDGHIDE